MKWFGFHDCSRLCSFHHRSIFATARGAVTSGAMKQSLLRCFDIGFFAQPNLQSRLLDGASKRKRQRPRQSRLESNIHGVQTGRGQFAGLATRQESNSRNSGGDGSQQTMHVTSATSSTDSCAGQFNPGSTMLGFRIIPSSSTRWQFSWMKTFAEPPPSLCGSIPECDRRP